jgi:hypothetical protein
LNPSIDKRNIDLCPEKIRLRGNCPGRSRYHSRPD